MNSGICNCHENAENLKGCTPHFRFNSLDSKYSTFVPLAFSCLLKQTQGAIEHVVLSKGITVETPRADTRNCKLRADTRALYSL